MLDHYGYASFQESALKQELKDFERLRKLIENRKETDAIKLIKYMLEQSDSIDPTRMAGCRLLRESLNVGGSQEFLFYEACVCNCVEVVKCYFENKIKVDLEKRDLAYSDKNPIEIATNMGYADLLNYLKEQQVQTDTSQTKSSNSKRELDQDEQKTNNSDQTSNKKFKK